MKIVLKIVHGQGGSPHGPAPGEAAYTRAAAEFPADAPLLRAEDLVKAFGGRTVVKGLSLEVRGGEILGLVGRNGAGKTTTFQMMVGLLKPDGGRILLDGEDISRRTTDERARRGIAFLPQEGSVFLKTSVAGNLRLPLEMRGFDRAERERRARILLDELGLTALANQAAHRLSGGERRRLEICRAMVLEPKFLLLDEPFSGVDPLTIVEIQKILADLRGRGIGVVVSDHNVRDTFGIADRACLIDEGCLLVEGPPAVLAEHPVARERFLGPNFTLGDEVRIPGGRGRPGRRASPPGRT